MTKQHSQFILALTVLIILYSGLTPKDFNNRHVASLLPEGGIEFKKYSLVKTDLISTNTFKLEQHQNMNPANPNNEALGFSMMLDISKFPETDTNNFKILAALSSKIETQQITLGQWKNTIIAMQGNDYRNEAQSPMLMFKLPESTLPRNRITLYFSANGANIMLNDRTMHVDDNISWTVPDGPFVVTLGNTLERTNAWLGRLEEFQFLVYSQQLSVVNGVETTNTATLQTTNSMVLLQYQFLPIIADTNHIIKNLSNNEINLYLEPAWTIASFDWLSETSSSKVFTVNSVIDGTLNLLGFLPFGFLLMYALYDRQRVAFLACATCLLGVGLSLGIETAQAVIPSRISSAQDLVLNSLGTLLGCTSAIIVSRQLQKTT